MGKKNIIYRLEKWEKIQRKKDDSSYELEKSSCYKEAWKTHNNLAIATEVSSQPLKLISMQVRSRPVKDSLRNK